MALLPTACFDDIQLDLPGRGDQKLVVEGYVNQGPEELEVFITVGTNAALEDEAGNVNLVQLAEAYLIYNGVPFPQYPLPNNQPVRYPVADFAQAAPADGSPVYELVVTLADGRSYRSAPEELPVLPRAGQVDVAAYTRETRNELGVLLEEELMEIKISTPLRVGNSEKALLRWEMTGVYRFVEAPPPISSTLDPQQTCYIPHDLSQNQILLFNGRETTEDELVRFPVIRDIPVDHLFASGYYVTIRQETLSPAAFRYWDQLRQNANPGGGLFDPTPGTVIGNVENIDDPEEQVLGFFYATQTDTIRRLIAPGELGNPRAYCDSPNNQGEIICRECTEIRNSSLEKPGYWVE